jgi:small subunit ribosomal protein S1
MADITEKASRELTMKDFFREENGEIVPIDESVLIDFQDGDIVEGEVVRIDKDEVLVDIGYKSEGLIPSNELTIRRRSSSSANASRRWSCRRRTPTGG